VVKEIFTKGRIAPARARIIQSFAAGNIFNIKPLNDSRISIACACYFSDVLPLVEACRQSV